MANTYKHLCLPVEFVYFCHPRQMTFFYVLAGRYKLAVLFLGLLCASLLAVIIGLTIMMSEKGQQLQDCSISQANCNDTAEERDELWRCFTKLGK